MEINIVASRNYIIDFVNDFLHDNDLIFFNDKNFETNGVILGDEINPRDFHEKDILINIGTKKDFDSKIEPLYYHPTIGDKDDFIYMTNFWDKNEAKITNTSFIWYPNRSPNAKYYGSSLSKKIRDNFNYGMQTVDSRYTMFNKVFAKYYWPDEANSYLEKLYNNGGVVPIRPLR